jgi:hypothetical protein
VGNAVGVALDNHFAGESGDSQSAIHLRQRAMNKPPGQSSGDKGQKNQNQNEVSEESAQV